MQPALNGIRVLDMAWIGPGPFCATLLGDLGAENIKIHQPDPDPRRGRVKLPAAVRRTGAGCPPRPPGPLAST